MPTNDLAVSSLVNMASRLFQALFQSSTTTTASLIMSVKPTVESAIANNKVMIFSKTTCSYCARVKDILSKEFANISDQIHIIELNEIDEGSAIQKYLAEKTGQTTVPNIFINQKHVGGCDDVVRLQRKGELAALVTV